MSENCPFCNIDSLKTRILNTSENTITILSNPALVNFHCLVIPKNHVEKLSDLNLDERNELFLEVVKLQSLLLKKFSGCDIRQNYRPFLQQSKLKVNHLHFHLIPRINGDELYNKSQIFEKDIFRDLPNEELNKLTEEFRELKNAN